MATSFLEYQKKELVLGLNAFDQPGELRNKEAWVRLIQNLLFMRPGSFPSLPDMGIGIQDYDFEFMDSAVQRLQTQILSQTQTYLPTIPLKSAVVDSSEVSGKPVLLIILTFFVSGKNDNAVMATMAARNVIDFEVSL